ncbi:MAG: hypothetical protein K8T20_12005, partial [Planctomycetes bacterium]|nr:hypothetical protein [Planctomycetota bacterium]
LENKGGELKGFGRACGRPFHLIEGTHRVSYLCRMLELALVSPTKSHEVVVVSVGAATRRS